MDRLNRGLDGAAGRDGGGQHEDAAVADQMRRIAAKDHLVAAGLFWRDNIDGPVLVR